jgi:thiosulfate dehydrogenase
MKCHGTNGEGQVNKDGATYLYPPLWGPHSYNQGAGLFRLSRLAGFIKNNMPNPVNYHNSMLTDEEAWDLAACINARPRPGFDLQKDWPVISTKPYDYPFGPYADNFSEKMHKFGPFQQIKNSRK